MECYLESLKDSIEPMTTSEIINKKYPFIAKELNEAFRNRMGDIVVDDPLFREKLLPELYQTDIAEEDVLKRFVMLSNEKILHDYLMSFWKLKLLAVVVKNNSMHILTNTVLSSNIRSPLAECLCNLLEVSPTLLHINYNLIDTPANKMNIKVETKSGYSLKDTAPKNWRRGMEIKMSYCHEGRQPQPKITSKVSDTEFQKQLWELYGEE